MFFLGEKYTQSDGKTVFSVRGDYSYVLVVTKSGYISQRNDNVLTNQDTTLHFSLVNEDADGKGDSSEGTPGFELIIAIVAVAFVFLLKRYFENL